jgi:Flp pilus assembly protein TadG
MNRNNEGCLHGARRGRRGQIIIFTTLFVPVLFGMGALTIDYGLVYVYNSQINASTQAAALAGAYAMSQTGATLASTTAVVTAYSGTSGDKNANTDLPGLALASGYPQLSCLNTLINVYGIQCWGPSGSNALVVKQTVTAPLLFLRVFGFSTVTLSATATAAMRGASSGPFNVAIIVDTTGSMNTVDSSVTCNNTRIYCALEGVQLLLGTLSPCLPTESSCGAASAGMVSNSVDRVSLFTFPSVTTATVAGDYNCGTSTPTTSAYATPFPATSTYQVLSFASDYRLSDSATSLNTSSNVVKAAGGKSGCASMPAIGGFGTYYAQVIYAAQAALVAEQSSYANSQNVIILLSDGDATATRTDMPGASTTSGVYISTLQQCHQAITAAGAAAAAGTRVYTVAYGAESSGCASDSPAITPCQTMEQIASSPNYFFSDYTATGGSSSCISAAQPATSLNQIFKAISMDLTNAKLIPNNTT